MSTDQQDDSTGAKALQVHIAQSDPIKLNVELECKRGELLALTGPSGSGKTTVLRTIAGLNRLATGTITCLQNVWQDTRTQRFLNPQQRRVGFVFQQYALFPHLTAIDQVKCAMTHVARIDRTAQANHWLALTNMDGLQNRKPHELSGGQRQRVALARALAREPDVLLLDEPFAAVDQLTREKLYRELAAIRSRLELPMILVTHDMLEVQQLADSICMMHHGSTLQIGKVEEVMQRPDTARIARLLGHKNCFSAKLIKTEQGARLQALGQVLELSAGALVQATEQMAVNDQLDIDMLIDPAAIIMHRQDRPSNGERENPVMTKVTEAVSLGNEITLKLQVYNSGELITFRLSKHVATRNAIRVGSQVRVSILAEGIHLMPTTS